MKKIKLFSIAAAFVAAFAFTSCNTGDDNNSYYQPLTQAEKQTCYLKTSGSRMSKLAYVSDEHVTEKDGKKEYHESGCGWSFLPAPAGQHLPLPPRPAPALQ